MNRRKLLKSSAASVLAATLASKAGAQTMTADSQASFDTVMAFMNAMGSGDMDKMSSLMADDMVWHNEGDKTLPWIRGDIAGKAAIFDFLPVFSSNLKTTKWENTDAFASGNTVAVFGAMAATATKTGHSTGDFSFALRAKVRDGQLILWHWFEDSFAVSQAYQRNK
ncbi:MAG: nuclear transport factor 2 family protein [Burkholderiaceae bacterium]